VLSTLTSVTAGVSKLPERLSWIVYSVSGTSLEPVTEAVSLNVTVSPAEAVVFLVSISPPTISLETSTAPVLILSSIGASAEP